MNQNKSLLTVLDQENQFGILQSSLMPFTAAPLLSLVTTTKPVKATSEATDHRPRQNMVPINFIKEATTISQDEFSPTVCWGEDNELRVLSEDKKSALRVPRALIISTVGSQQYHLQGPSGHTTFHFQLCRAFRGGKCMKESACTFIHSRHITSPALRSGVHETPVHENIVVASFSGATYGRLPPGIPIQLSDKGRCSVFMVDSSWLYTTRGALDIINAAAYSHPAGLQVKLHLCSHFDKGMCARGADCLFAHRILLSTFI